MRISISSLLAWAVILSVIGYPLVAGLSELLSINNRTLSITMRAVVIAMSLPAFLQIDRSKLSHPSIFTILFTAFWGMYLARMAFDTTFKIADLGRLPLDYWAFGFGTCFLPAFALLSARRLPDEKILKRWMFSLAILAVLLVGALGDTRATSSTGIIYDSGRFNLDALNPIFFGHLGATILLLSYWTLRMGREGILHKGFYYICITLGATAIIWSGSRGPLVSTIFSIIFIEVAKKKFRLTIVIFLISSIILLSSFDFADLVKLDALLGSSIFERLVGAIMLTDTSVSGRLLQVKSGLSLFLDNPIIGSALEDPTFKIYPHNVFVEAFMATGLIGGLFFSAFLFGVLLKAYQLVEQKSIYGFLTPITVQYVIAAQFSGGLWNSNAMWILIALIASIKLECPNFSIQIMFRDRAQEYRAKILKCIYLKIK